MTPGNKSSEWHLSLVLVGIFVLVLALAVWRHDGLVTVAAIGGNILVGSAYTISRGLAKACPSILERFLINLFTPASPARNPTMTDTVTAAPEVTPVVTLSDATTLTPVDNFIVGLAKKIDSTDSPELASLMIAGIRYGLKKLGTLANNSKLLEPYSAEVKAVEGILSSQI